ncbi:hypothetical protein ABW20_dc0104149 [Dactylellina cionopaga]|nr:hypothetical protein ABW20_dc0104149 [Dactylellina cionopaga]
MQNASELPRSSSSTAALPTSSSPEKEGRLQQQGSNSTALPISTLPPNVSIRAPTKANIHQLKRINSLLLPVSYPENFYRDILQQPESEILTRLAFYDEECVGGIRCRVETEAEYKAGLERLCLKDNSSNAVGSRILQAIANDGRHPSFNPRQPGTNNGNPKKKIYIMTLAVLSPYRSLSIGSHLLDYIVSTAAKDPSIDADEAYAHVWVANDGALDFYRKQGFDVDGGALVRDYYRRLDPRDAKVVLRKISS